MVVLAVVVIFVMYNWFSGTASAQETSWQPYNNAAGKECTSNSECVTNPDGTLCISMTGSSFFCGCLDDLDCIAGRICDPKANRCL